MQHEKNTGKAATPHVHGASSLAVENAARPLDWRRGETPLKAMTFSSALDGDEDDDGVLSLRHEEGSLVVAGDIDLHQVHEFRSGAEDYIQTAEQPRLDLSGVPYLDSAGLAALLSLSRFATGQNKQLKIVATGAPRRVLRITGIDRVILVED